MLSAINAAVISSTLSKVSRIAPIARFPTKRVDTSTFRQSSVKFPRWQKTIEKTSKNKFLNGLLPKNATDRFFNYQYFRVSIFSRDASRYVIASKSAAPPGERFLVINNWSSLSTEANVLLAGTEYISASVSFAFALA